MKNKRAFLVMTVAVLFGLAAVYLALKILKIDKADTSARIVVAATDVNPGQRLTPDMLKLADIPVASQPKGAFTDPQKVAGRVLKSSVLRDDAISEAKLAPVGTVGGLSALITEGKRAITVRVNDVIGVAGFALPGNFVDIIVSTQKEPSGGDHGGREQNISKIVLEHILVLAVAQEVGRDETKPRVVNAVTLEVTPAQAENLDLARSVGTLSLALRNQVDPQDAQTEGATKRTLLREELVPLKPVAATATAKPAAKAAPVKRAAPAERHCIGVMNGVHLSRECLYSINQASLQGEPNEQKR